MRDQITSFYGHIPEGHRELFTANPPQVYEVAKNLDRIKRHKLFIHFVPSSLEEIHDHPKWRV
jgi:hypothetical protein